MTTQTQMVTVEALRPTFYHKTYLPGAIFEMKPAWAEVLAKQRMVRIVDRAADVAEEVLVARDTENSKPRRRRYKRRDMTSEE